MGPLAATQSVLRNYATMSGRATRSEYWWWGLVQGLILLSLCTIAAAAVEPTGPTTLAMVAGGAAFVFMLATLVPNICVMVRRLHDTGRSGAWYFITFVPVIGGIWFLVLMLLGSEDRPNIYGGPPNSDGSPPSGPISTRAPSDDIYSREDVSNAYVAAYTTDPRAAAMRKAAANGEEVGADFAAQRKAEISDYYKRNVLGGAKSGAPEHS